MASKLVGMEDFSGEGGLMRRVEVNRFEYEDLTEAFYFSSPFDADLRVFSSISIKTSNSSAVDTVMM